MRAEIIRHRGAEWRRVVPSDTWAPVFPTRVFHVPGLVEATNPYEPCPDPESPRRWFAFVAKAKTALGKTMHLAGAADLYLGKAVTNTLKRPAEARAWAEEELFSRITRALEGSE